MQYCKQTVESTFKELTILSSIFGFLPTRNFLNSLPLTPNFVLSHNLKVQRLFNYCQVFQIYHFYQKSSKSSDRSERRIRYNISLGSDELCSHHKKILGKFILMNKNIFKKILFTNFGFLIVSSAAIFVFGFEPCQSIRFWPVKNKFKIKKYSIIANIFKLIFYQKIQYQIGAKDE